MALGRREFIITAGAAMVLPPAGRAAAASSTEKGAQAMYGLIGKMVAVDGQRDALIAVLLQGVGEMPGCRSYVVAKDPKEPNAVWITEVWDSEQSHRASLAIPSVKDAIAKGRPMIAGFSDAHTTEPVGGFGLSH